ncbi:AJL2 protein, partial [Atractosteus spatula]|nr:AJL2 protein [Atractosteus spatula]
MLQGHGYPAVEESTGAAVGWRVTMIRLPASALLYIVLGLSGNSVSGRLNNDEEGVVCQVLCPPGWVNFEKRCFQYIRQEKTWVDAEGSPNLIELDISTEQQTLGTISTERKTTAETLPAVSGRLGANTAHVELCKCPCPPGWVSFANRCFQYIGTEKTWADAEMECIKLGGNLASVHSEEENTLLLQLIKSNKTSNTWIGGSDGEKEELLCDLSWQGTHFGCQVPKDEGIIRDFLDGEGEWDIEKGCLVQLVPGRTGRMSMGQRKHPRNWVQQSTCSQGGLLQRPSHAVMVDCGGTTWIRPNCPRGGDQADKDQGWSAGKCGCMQQAGSVEASTARDESGGIGM